MPLITDDDGFMRVVRKPPVVKPTTPPVTPKPADVTPPVVEPTKPTFIDDDEPEKKPTIEEKRKVDVTKSFFDDDRKTLMLYGISSVSSCRCLLSSASRSLQSVRSTTTSLCSRSSVAVKLP